MTTTKVLLIVAAGAIALYAAFVIALLLLGRREDARALVGFVPDCVVLFSRLLRDKCVSRGRRILLVGLLVYLASPLDLVPDFIPVAGQVDDALIVVLVLRLILGQCGAQMRVHWPGPRQSLDLLLRLARVKGWDG